MPTNNYAENADDTKARIKKHHKENNSPTEDQIITFMRDNAHAELRIGLQESENLLGQNPRQKALDFYNSVVKQLELDKPVDNSNVVKSPSSTKTRRATSTIVPFLGGGGSSPQQNKLVLYSDLSAAGLDRGPWRRISDLFFKMFGFKSARSQAKDNLLEAMAKDNLFRDIKESKHYDYQYKISDLQNVVQDLKKGRQKMGRTRTYGEKSGEILVKIQTILEEGKVIDDQSKLVQTNDRQKLKQQVEKELDSCPTIRKT